MRDAFTVSQRSLTMKFRIADWAAAAAVILALGALAAADGEPSGPQLALAR